MALHLNIVTPERKIFSDTVDDVYLPGVEGEMGILDLHAALVSAIEPGELRYLKDGQVTEMAIGEGFVEVADNVVNLLCDLAVTEAEVDRAQVEAAMKRAEESLKRNETDRPEEIAALQATIASSLAQLRLKNKKARS